MSTFYQLEKDKYYPSSENDDLIEKPDGEYKMGSFEIIAKNTKLINSRQTYGILDWLGDVGGLNDALFIIVQIALTPFTKFYYASFIMRQIFRWKPAGPQLEKADKESVLKEKALEKTTRIDHMDYLKYCFCYCWSKRRETHRRTLIKAWSKLDKEMDLRKFLIR